MFNNTRFEPGCNVPGLTSITVGLYPNSVSSSGTKSLATMATVFSFDSATTRQKFTCVRIEKAGEGFMARLMPRRLDCYTSKNLAGAPVLSDYNYTDYRAIAIRGQQWLGLDNEKSNSNMNTVVVSSISSMVDGEYGLEMHIYFTIEKTRNFNSNSSATASTSAPVSAPVSAPAPAPVVAPTPSPTTSMKISILDPQNIIDAKVEACVRNNIAFDFVA